jgi:hypothetical protein
VPFIATVVAVSLESFAFVPILKVSKVPIHLLSCHYCLHQEFHRASSTR